MKGVELRACDAGSTEHASRVQTKKATAGEVDSGVDYGTGTGTGTTRLL